MAFPFGGHPTLERIVEWAVINGCESSVSVRTTKDGRSYQVLLLVRKDNHCRVSIVEPDFQERLSPSTVSYIQRRLAIKMPFAEQPELTQDASG